MSYSGRAGPRRRIRRAVVTGGAGFLGSHICEKLLAEGVSVVSLDNFQTGMARNVSHLIGRPGFRCIECDVTGFMHVPGRVDLVLHLASAASPADYLRFPIETLKAGGLGTMHALDMACEKDARFVLASTSEVYGDPLQHPQPESYWGNVSPVGPRSAYDEAKRYAEAMTMAYRQSRGADTGIVRIFNPYGPRMRPNDGRAIPTFIGQALTGRPITVTGSGSQTRSICYVDDTVRGILAMCYSDLEGPVNIGNDAELTVMDLATLVRDLTGSRSPVSHIGRPQDDPRVRRPDTTLARERLGWQPYVSPADGLRRTIAWFSRELGDELSDGLPTGWAEVG